MAHSKTVTQKRGNKKMTTYYIRGSIIWINYYVDGVRKQKSTKLKNTPQNIKVVTSKIIPSLDIKIATGEIYKKKPKTFEYYGGIFLKQKSEDKNYFQMKYFYERIKPYFGNINVDEITRLDIKQYLLNLNIKSIIPYKTVFSSVFELAVDDGVIAINPGLNLKVISSPRRKVEYFTKDEVNKILDTVSHDILRVYLMIAFNTGMRSGEILGLQLGDFEERYINIRRTRTLGVIGSGKNANALRKVPYPSFLLDEVKKIQGNHIFIFGKLDDSSRLNYWWHNCIREANVKKLRLYCTRHTFATLMLQKNIISINELAGILGHSSVKTTLDRYAAAISPDTVNFDRDFSLYCDKSVTIKKHSIV